MNTENMNEDVRDTFQTRDVYLTASLLACGCTIADMTKRDKQYTFFVTNDAQNVMRLVDKYWDGQLLLDAKKLFSSFRELRARMYN